MDNLEFVRQYNLVEFCFSKEGAFIKAVDGLEYWYDLRHPAGMLHGACWGDHMVGVELDLILKNIRAGSVVFDVGAGIGEYAINIASKMEGATVYAFEPTYETWQSLQKNVARNRLADRIHCNQVALADTPGKFGLTSTAAGNYIFRQSESRSQPDTAHETVIATTVDTFIRENKIVKVDFIKADIEGAELLMLKGAAECLRLYKPFLQLEIDERWTNRMGYSYIEIFKHLTNLGYQYVFISSKDGSVCQPQDNQDIAQQLEKGYNFFFYHKSKSMVY